MSNDRVSGRWPLTVIALICLAARRRYVVVSWSMSSRFYRPRSISVQTKNARHDRAINRIRTTGKTVSWRWTTGRDRSVSCRRRAPAPRTGSEWCPWWKRRWISTGTTDPAPWPRSPSPDLPARNRKQIEHCTTNVIDENDLPDELWSASRFATIVLTRLRNPDLRACSKRDDTFAYTKKKIH